MAPATQPHWNDPVGALPGIGKVLSSNLAELGIHTIADLLTHTPARYVAIREVGGVQGVLADPNARIRVSVKKAYTHRGKRVAITTAEATDDDGTSVTLRFFGQPWLAKRLEGATIICSGALSGTRMDVKEWVSADELTPAELTSGLRAVYPAGSGISADRMRGLIERALAVAIDPADPLPPRLCGDLPTRLEALRLIHQPTSAEEARRGRERLVFEELFIAQLALQLLRGLDATLGAPALDDPTNCVGRVIDTLPHALSRGQERVWAKLTRRFDSSQPMRVLVQGEVGAGKSVIAALAAARAAGSDQAALIVAPTTLLARQLHASVSAMLEPAGLSVELVTAEQDVRTRRVVEQRLQTGTSLVAVGTHALLNRGAELVGDRLGLVVIDEQHRFGVGQRHALLREATRSGRPVHLLQLTATPIPRSLALTSYGDLDVVTLAARDDTRQQITTRLGDDDDWVHTVEQAVAAGGAAFVVCPRIGEASDARGAVSDALRARLGALRVEVVHGRLAAADRDQAMQRFASGDADVLIATSLVEVGIDIARANAMVILDADAFGLAQLHQLRGRVGRQGQPAECVLVPSDEATDDAYARLEQLAATTDGLALAKLDLSLRGAGTLAGTSQSGGEGFKIARLGRDDRVLAAARHAARVLLRDDPTLAGSDLDTLRALVASQISALSGLREH